MKKQKEVKKRIALIDFLRGAAIINMLLYHMAFTFSEMFGFDFFMPYYRFIGSLPFMEVYFGGIFIVISGIASSFSRSNTRRGLITFGFALAINAVTIFILPLMGYGDMRIYFGILHLLSVSMLISPLFIKMADKIPAYIGVSACVLLFGLTYNIGAGYIGLSGDIGITIPEGIRLIPYLLPLGIVGGNVRSLDHYPLFPWIFMFIMGIYIGRKIKSSKPGPRWYKTVNAPVEWLGRHTLAIYVAHQPVIFLLGTVLNRLM